MTALTAVGWLPPEIGLLVFFGLVGLFAGVARAASGVKPLQNLVQNALVGAVTAFLAGCICLQMWGTEGHLYLSIAIAGLCGWLGTRVLDWAGAVLMAAANRKAGSGNEPPAPTS